MDVPQERLSKRTGEQFDDEPVSQVMKEIFEVARMFPQEGSQQCTAEENEMQPLIMEEIVEVVRSTVKEQISERICEQIMEVPVPKDTQQLIEMATFSDQDRILQRALEQIIDVPGPPPFEKSEEQTEIGEMMQIISLERLQQRGVEQLVDMAATRVIIALVEVVRLIHQERHFERKEEHIVDLLEQQVVKEIFEGIHGDKSAWWHWLETECEGDGCALWLLRETESEGDGSAWWRWQETESEGDGSAGWRLTPSVLSRRRDAYWRLCPTKMGRRGKSCNAGTDSCVSSLRERDGSIFRSADELKIVSEHDVVYVSTSKNLRVGLCSEQRSIFRGSSVQLSLRREFEWSVSIALRGQRFQTRPNWSQTVEKMLTRWLPNVGQERLVKRFAESLLDCLGFRDKTDFCSGWWDRYWSSCCTFSSGTVIRKDLWKHGESPFPHLIVEQICDAPAEDELY